MGSESSIESAVKRYAVEKGFYVRKFSSPSNRGVPDDLFISPDGDFFFIEFKAPGKQPTPLQLREARLIEKNKGEVYFVDNVKEGQDIIRGYLLF
jgi:hypothetical protein